ncbi:MAG TPA: electron transfer flavoprotein subunit beta/FixA family protein [Gammaproteobacteria bacterium]|nr:electron transfer flavoprotein subunit beta/FixA family protein [Gammaproteobacteria bacterium]
MKILVGIKRVVDPNVAIHVKSDGSGVETTNIKMTMNPFCEIAVEEALRIREAGNAKEIIVVSAGPKNSQETLRSALAMGADRAIHIPVEETRLEPLAVAKLLQAVTTREQPDLVLLGKQTIDDDYNQTGQMLASLLGWSLGTFASKIKVGDEMLTVTREIDGGMETLRLTRPVVVTSDLRLNEPRYVTLPNIMKAKRKTIESLSAEELGVDIAPRLEILAVEPPAGRKAGVIVGSVAELVDKLKNEAKVI